MNMHLTIRLTIVVSAALAAACGVDEDGKNACLIPTDCLGGFACVDGTCVDVRGAGPDGGTGDDGDDGDGLHLHDAGGDKQYGDVEPLDSQSAGMAAINYDTLVGLATAPGGLGCALVGNESASPGTAAAAVYAKIEKEGGDARCPQGVYAIVSNPSECHELHFGLRPGCALYKRWSDTGEQVASRPATGGFVSVQNIYRSEMERGCEVEVSLSFAGGTTIATTFTFDYNPYGPAESFCAH
jgi:hypothetical protein